MDLGSSTSYTFFGLDLAESAHPVSISPPAPKQLLLFKLQAAPLVLKISFVNTSRVRRRPPRCFIETASYTLALLLVHNYFAGDFLYLWSRWRHFNLSSVK
ncbi:unnamed protein product [Urochloa humidicola]